MKNLNLVLKASLFLLSFLFVSNIAFAQEDASAVVEGADYDCAQTMKEAKLLFSGWINHPSNKNHLNKMTKQEASAVRIAKRNLIYSMYGGDCYNGPAVANRSDCEQVRLDVKPIYSGILNHPSTRRRTAKMTRQERAAFRQAWWAKLKTKLGAGCYNAPEVVAY